MSVFPPSAVSSPYAVFRAVDLGWPTAVLSAPPSQAALLTPPPSRQEIRRPRKSQVANTQPDSLDHSFVQGTLFSPSLFTA